MITETVVCDWCKERISKIKCNLCDKDICGYCDKSQGILLMDYSITTIHLCSKCQDDLKKILLNGDIRVNLSNIISKEIIPVLKNGQIIKELNTNTGEIK